MRIKFSKSFKILGIVIVSIVVLILIVRGVFNFTVTKKLNATVEKMKAEGRRIDMKDFEIQCEDSENAALPWKEIEEMFSQEGFKLVEDALNKVLDGETLDKEERAKIIELISENKPSFELFNEAIKRPHFKYETNWEQSAWAFRLPNAVKLIRFMRLYGLDAFFNAEKGELNDAIDQNLSWLTFSSKLFDEPFVLPHLITIAVTRPQIALMNRIISSRILDDETLNRILSSLDIDTLQKGQIRSFESEGAAIYDLFTRTLDGKADVKDIDGGIYAFKFFVWLFKPLIKADMLYSMKLFDEIVKASKKPYHEFLKIRESYHDKVDNIPRYYFFSYLLVPNLGSARFKKATTEAKILAARVGIACKIFKNRHGKFPEQLSQLVPDILSEVPTDPFSGKSLIYRKTPSGFIVYSVGSNGKDDGGKETREITRMATTCLPNWAPPRFILPTPWEG